MTRDLVELAAQKGKLLIAPKIRTQLNQYDYHLPNGLREILLQLGYAKALLVIEGLYELKYAGETWLTFEQIFRLLRDNFEMSYQLVYRGLCSGLIFQRRKAERKANQRGARPYLYRLPFPEELQAEFAPDLKPTPHDKLERADLKTVSAYCSAMHRELVVRLWLESGGKGFVMYRDKMADRVDKSVRTIRSYDKKWGFSYDANYKKKEVTLDNLGSLPRYKDKFGENGKRLPSRKWLETYDWKTGIKTNLPLVRFLAYRSLHENKEVYEVERLANTYYPYQKPDLSQFGSSYSVDYYWALIAARNEAGFFQKSDGSWNRRE